MVSRILIVDDVEYWRETFKDMLVTIGYDVDVFEKFTEVKNSLITTRYDLALLDIDLKSSEGYLDFELIYQMLHDQYEQIPIVAVSGQLIDPEFMFNLPKRERIKGFLSKNDKNLITKPRSLIKDLIPSQTDIEADELDYPIEKQEWYTPQFIPTIVIDKKQIDILKNDIDVAIITTTVVEIKAVIHFLKPYPEYQSILEAYVGPDTYYLGKFGEYRAVVTRCHMGGIDQIQQRSQQSKFYGFGNQARLSW